MKTLLKLLRTVIGLPFVLLFWSCETFVIGLLMIVSWVEEGKFYWFPAADKDLIQSPIKWLRDVWRKQ